MSPFEPQESFEHLDKLSYEIGPRLAGSERSARTVEYLEDRFEDYGLETETQEFGFVDMIRRVRLKMLVLLSIFLVSFLLDPVPNLVVVVAGLGLYWVLPRALPKEPDVNLIGTLKPEGDVEKRIVVGAHYDSAYCTESKKWSLFVKIALPVVISVLVLLSILKIFIGQSVWTTAWVIFSIPYLLTSLLPFWLYGNVVSPGAEDNASGVSVLMELARVTSNSPPENTEIDFVAWGGEEQGLAGSKKYASELDDIDFFLNLDSLGSGESLCIIEGNGIFRKKRTTSEINEAIEEEEDIDWVWTPFSGHDHIPFLDRGMKATTLSSTQRKEKGDLEEFLEKTFSLSNVTIGRLPQIHTLEDIPDEIKLENIRDSGKIALGLLGIDEE